MKYLIFLCLFMVAGCKITDSFTIFDSSRLKAEDLEQIVGIYEAEGVVLSVEFENDETDRLKFSWGSPGTDEQDTNGSAIVTHVPGSDLLLASVEFSQMLGDPIEGFSGVFGIVLLKPLDAKSFMYIPVPNSSEFGKAIDAIQDVESEREYIRSYIIRNADTFSATDGPIYYRIESPPSKETAAILEPEPLTSVNGLYVINDFSISQYRYTGELTAGGAPIFDLIIVQLPGPDHYSSTRIRGVKVGDVSGRGAYLRDTQQFYVQDRAFGRCTFFTDLDWSPVIEHVNIAPPWETPFMAYVYSKNYVDGRRPSARVCLRPRVNQNTCTMVGCRLWSDNVSTDAWNATFVWNFDDAQRLFNNPLR